MSLKRRVAVLENWQREHAAVAQQKAEREAAERLHGFWEQLDARLQAAGHWCIPGEDFLSYLARGMGFDAGTLRQAVGKKDQAVVNESVRAILERFPDLESVWHNAAGLAPL